MPASRRKDRSRLDGFEKEIFQLVRKHATEGQWMKWLRAPLEHAAAQGDMELFTRLMDAGADGGAGWRGCHGRTLLGAAAHGKSVEMVLTLLEAGAMADVNVTFGAKQESVLHVAAAHGAEQICDMLILAAGADATTVDKDKSTPLHLAAEAGHDDVVITLLASGADPYATNKWAKQTPLHLAAAAGHALCVSYLMHGGADKDSRDGGNRTPLFLAAQHNRLEAVEQLLAAGASQHIRSTNGPYVTALDTAAKQGHAEVVRALVKRGSPVNASDRSGRTALHLAASVDEVLGRVNDHDNGEVIHVLLQAGADTEAKTKNYGRTPLHFAASSDSNGNNVRALLEGGANVNARGTDGGTPLHDACLQCRLSAVVLLLRWGADEKLRDNGGTTAEDGVGGENGESADCNEEREADDMHIRWMLARAPADRSWRRRGWLVMARSCPAKVQLAKESGGDGGGTGNGKEPGGGGSGTRDQTGIDLEHLVGAVVGLDETGVFRAVVGFL